jgi:hypothetical protein
MPFDGTEFFREQAARTGGPLAWGLRIATALIQPFRARLRRAPEPIDAAVLRVLAEARGLIERREDWTQGTLETFRGERCAVGALRLAAGFLNYELAGRLAHARLAEIAAERGFSSIEAMNDYSRHEAVLSAFDMAIVAVRR